MMLRNAIVSIIMNGVVQNEMFAKKENRKLCLPEQNGNATSTRYTFTFKTLRTVISRFTHPDRSHHSRESTRTAVLAI